MEFNLLGNTVSACPNYPSLAIELVTLELENLEAHRKKYCRNINHCVSAIRDKPA